MDTPNRQPSATLGKGILALPGRIATHVGHVRNVSHTPPSSP